MVYLNKCGEEVLADGHRIDNKGRNWESVAGFCRSGITGLVDNWNKYSTASQ
jgi:hypothetical protein